MYGKTLRMKRLFPGGDRRLFAVPLDHSVSMGPIDGLEAMAPVIDELQRGGVDLFIVTKGAVREVVPVLNGRSLLGVHISASTSLGLTPNRKVLVGTAEEAVALGADVLSVQVNFGTPEEPEMLSDLGLAVDQARRLGLPLLCMAYVKKATATTLDDLKHAARAAADLGADIVKTSYPGSEESYKSLVRSTPVPVLIGGGVRTDDEQVFLDTVHASLRAGGAGICIGRNLFQRRPLEPLARRLAGVLHPTG
ncbi:MAG: 2-amino-3,7-dideoxy-D-threo-hept-6-ulosonate synthase [Thermoplasmata archaeon]|nr:2-amino-3,7-dideoxy-D-threo-hept-6-ulosonate synthase [Thermoplasmata archaeon]